jgi:hypothetical protein
LLRAESELLMSEIFSQQVSITTTGSAGSATGSGTAIGINGFLLDVYLNYHASAPATTDVTISDPTFGTILVRGNTITDAWHMPRKETCDSTGAGTGMYELIPVNDTLTISVAQCNALTDALVATVRWITP